jgi:LPS-assembly protein
MKKSLIFVVLMLGHLSVSAGEVVLDCSPDQTNCENCPEHSTLFPVEIFSSNSGSLDIEADESEILEEKYLLSGNVEVNSESLFLSADDVEVLSSDNSILATGNVNFQDEAYLITSDYLYASRKDEKLIATATNANYQDYSVGLGGANGFTEKLEKTPSSVLLTNSTYSLCPIDKNDWLIDADQIELKLDKNRGVADNALIKFYGVPIFYTPKYSWVLSGRGSGFLTPDYTSYSEHGIEKDSYRIRVPYYFNLAPDRDLIAAVTYMSSRRFIYEGKFRQLIAPKTSYLKKDSMYYVDAKYLPEDKITSLKRWLLDFSLEWEINERVHLSSKYNRASDSKYFKEIARTNTNAEKLNSHLKLNYLDKENNLNFHILTEDEQIVNSGSPGYIREIEGSIGKVFRTDKKVPVSTGLVSTRFKHKVSGKESGVRTHGSIGISSKLNIKYPLVTPRAGVDITNYSLTNSPNINRTIFGAGLDIDFGIERSSNLFRTKVTNKITPLITYNYRAKKVQGDIPIFDSTDKYDDIISFADLTSGERYTGLDRITNANDITLSLSSSYRNIDAPIEDKNLLTLGIAQSFYSDDEVVSDSLNTNYDTRRSYSDIAASIDFSLNNYTISAAAQFDPDSTKIVKKNYLLGYKPSSRKFITLNFIDKGTETTDKIYGAFPLNDSLHLFGGLEKITTSIVSKTETTGFSFESCCWAFRLAHFKEGSKSGGYSYSTGMELVLTGLGSTSSPLKGKIEGNIPGYKAKLR